MIRRIHAWWVFALPLVSVVGCAEGTFPDATDEADVSTKDPTEPVSDAGRQQSAEPSGTDDATEEPSATTTTDAGSSKTDSGSAKPVVDSGVVSSPTTAVTQGDFVISEVMFDPSGTEPDTEWIELYNTASTAKSLNGLTLKDGAARIHTIASSPTITVQPGAYVVLARDKSAAILEQLSSASIVYEYGAGVSSGQGVSLTNSTTGAIFLMSGTTQIARAEYAGWFSSASGASIQLKTLTYAASNTASSWCLSSKAWASGSDKGTPGKSSDCP